MGRDAAGVAAHREADEMSGLLARAILWLAGVGEDDKKWVIVRDAEGRPHLVEEKGETP